MRHNNSGDRQYTILCSRTGNAVGKIGIRRDDLRAIEVENAFLGVFAEVRPAQAELVPAFRFYDPAVQRSFAHLKRGLPDIVIACCEPLRIVDVEVFLDEGKLEDKR